MKKLIKKKNNSIKDYNKIKLYVGEGGGGGNGHCTSNHACCGNDKCCG